MKLFELNLNWADRDNANRPTNFDSDNLVMLRVNIEDVIKHMHSEFKLDLGDELGGKNSIGDRLPRAKEHFKAGGAMDLPEIGYSKWSKTIDFGNVRHRTVAAHQLGKKYIPMFVSIDGIDEFKKLVRTEPM